MMVPESSMAGSGSAAKESSEVGSNPQCAGQSPYPYLLSPQRLLPPFDSVDRGKERHMSETAQSEA
ncbi:hypothetical protein, partial [Bifidobacterium sp.]|uniref:hypothetical protein n=1 Tax=Bifidobacterium sp. TaxID=41200 RepID=UPI003D7E4712